MKDKKINLNTEPIDQYKDVKINIGKKIAYPTFGGFPLNRWKEYDTEVERDYSGIRWAKAWEDHILAKQHKREEKLWTMIIELNNRVSLLESRGTADDKNKEEKPIHFGKEKVKQNE